MDIDQVSEEVHVAIKNEECQQQDESLSKKINGKKLRRIRHQMEFYFSDANLKRDTMLTRMIQENEDGYVDLNVFMSFNKIRALTESIEDLIKALSQSSQLELDVDKTKVHRKVSFEPKPKQSSESLTIYAERIPSHASHKFLKNVFQRFGKVTYVTLPRFRNSDKNKGFAFVEFESEESVKLACEAYKQYEKEKSTNTATSDEKCEEGKEKSELDHSPAEVCAKSKSRKRRKSENVEQTPEKARFTAVPKVENAEESFSEKEGEEKSNLDNVQAGVCAKSKSRKRKKSESVEQTPEKVSNVEIGEELASENLSKLQKHDTHTAKHGKRRKRQSSECETTPKKSRMPSNFEDSVNIAKPDSSNSNSKVVQEAGTTCDPSTSPPLQKDKKNDETADGDVNGTHKRQRIRDSEKLKLKVMSVAEWKMHRNRYLSMQRKAMSAIKKMLLIDQQQRNECESVLCHPSTSRERQKTQDSGTQSSNEKNCGITFQEGVIIKILVSEDIAKDDPKELREKIKASASDVAFVDTTSLPDSKIYIRFHGPGSANTAVKNESLNKIGMCEIISGEEEGSYWEKVKLDRAAQRNRQRPKVRGREKILAKSEKIFGKNNHIIFD